MVVLSVLLLGAVSGLSLTISRIAGHPEGMEKIDGWIRQLGDSDSDIVREGWRNLLHSGSKALPQLRAAARSENPQVAARARELIRRIEGPQEPEP